MSENAPPLLPGSAPRPAQVAPVHSLVSATGEPDGSGYAVAPSRGVPPTSASCGPWASAIAEPPTGDQSACAGEASRSAASPTVSARIPTGRPRFIVCDPNGGRAGWTGF